MSKDSTAQPFATVDAAPVKDADAQVDAGLAELETALVHSVGCAFTLARAVITRLRTSAEPVEDRIVSAVEGARYLGITAPALHEMARRGKITSIEMPGTGRNPIRRFSMRVLERYRSEFRGRADPPHFTA